MEVNAIAHVVFNAGDVEASAAGYEKALGRERQVSCSDDGSVRTSMTSASNKINLRPMSASQEVWLTARTPTSGSDDLCFLTDTLADEVASHFRDLGIAIGPVNKKGALGPSARSMYVIPTAT